MTTYLWQYLAVIKGSQTTTKDPSEWIFKQTLHLDVPSLYNIAAIVTLMSATTFQTPFLIDSYHEMFSLANHDKALKLHHKLYM